MRVGRILLFAFLMTVRLGASRQRTGAQPCWHDDGISGSDRCPVARLGTRGAASGVFVQLTQSSSESLVDDESHFSSLGTGVSVLFYSPLSDNLNTYVAPRFSYTRTSGDSTTTESTTDMYSFGGMFGAHYSLGQRFAVFGEVGAITRVRPGR